MTHAAACGFWQASPRNLLSGQIVWALQQPDTTDSLQRASEALGDTSI
jgi:hypothetical protein